MIKCYTSELTTNQTSRVAMAEAAQTLRPTNDEARELGRFLVRGARFMSLAVLDPETGFPSVSRALTIIDLDGTPVVLVSTLSGHTKGLIADPRCSLLAGEPAKGDPLAHARITLHCEAKPVVRNSAAHDRIRARFLARHPKAQLYIDFPDFLFFRLQPRQAALNGGFGRAYMLENKDFAIAEPANPQAWLTFQNNLPANNTAADILARRLNLDGKNWRFGLVDPAGVDLICGDLLVRHEFPNPKDLPEHVMHYICSAAKVQHELPKI